jgi:hypothetical protein
MKSTLRSLKSNQWVNFDPATGRQLIAGRDGVSRTANINTDYHAIAPRISFAYQAGKTVIRSGYGLFYFPQGNAGTNIRQFRQPPYDFVVNQPFSGNDVPTTRAAQGFPIVTTAPDLTRGPALFALRGVTPDFRNGQMQQFNFSVQRELTKDLVATAGYVGSAGAKLYWARNLNLPDPGPGAVDPRRPYAAQLAGVTGITWLESSANSFFSSLQATIEKRFSSGFYFSKLDLGALVRQLWRGWRQQRADTAEPERSPGRLGQFQQRHSPPRQPCLHLPAPVRTRPQVCEIRRCRGLLDRRMGNRRACGAPKRAAVHRAGVGLAFEHQRGKPGQSSYRSESLSFEPVHWPLV